MAKDPAKQTEMVNIRVVKEVKREMQRKALKFTNGNLTKLIVQAVLDYIPNSRPPKPSK